MTENGFYIHNHTTYTTYKYGDDWLGDGLLLFYLHEWIILA